MAACSERTTREMRMASLPGGRAQLAVGEQVPLVETNRAAALRSHSCHYLYHRGAHKLQRGGGGEFVGGRGSKKKTKNLHTAAEVERQNIQL